MSSVYNGRQPGRGSPPVSISLANIFRLLFQGVLPSEAYWGKQFLASQGSWGWAMGREGRSRAPPP